jgi:hypothetical protein
LENSFYKDAESRYLWRFPGRRLEAESIRDSMLAVSGQLNLKMHGRGFNLFDQRGGLSGFDPIETFTPDNQRRMIYAHKVRREPETVFRCLRLPRCRSKHRHPPRQHHADPGPQPLQQPLHPRPDRSLRLTREKEAGDNIAKQITRAYHLALSREPTREELDETQSIVRQHGIATLCRALFNSNEFLFVP